VLYSKLKIEVYFIPGIRELREVRVEMCDTVDKYLSERMEQRVQIKLIKSCLFAKIGCCLPRDCDAKTFRHRAAPPTSPPTPWLCLSPLCIRTRANFWSVCTRGTWNSACYCVVTPGQRVHLCIELGMRCISPEIASTRTDLIAGEKHDVTRSIKCASQNQTRVCRDESVECIRKWLRIYVYRLRAQWILHGSEIILVLYLTLRIFETILIVL